MFCLLSEWACGGGVLDQALVMFLFFLPGTRIKMFYVVHAVRMLNHKHRVGLGIGYCGLFFSDHMWI